jgi:predicted SAM-dependent methyltransferase
MEHQGMVHALEEIHRLLKPDGLLIDIHPAPELTLIRVYDHGTVLLEEPLVDTADEEIIQAERALAEVADRGLFVVGMSHEFDCQTYASSVGELQDYLELMNAFDNSPVDEAAVLREQELAARVDKMLRKSGAGAEVAYYEKGKITRMRPVK